MYCTNCGAELKDDAKFCTNCGEKVKAEIQKHNDNYSHSDIDISSENSKGSNSIKNILLGFYFLLNIPLYILSDGNEQMLGFLFYSLVIIIIIAIRIKKENTFNLVLKILIGLQLLFVLSIFISQFEYLFIDLQSFLGTIVFLFIAIVLILMLVKGNDKSQSYKS